MPEAPIMTDIPPDIWINACFMIHCLHGLYPDRKCMIGQDMKTFESENASKCSAAAKTYPERIIFVEPVEVSRNGGFRFLDRYMLLEAQKDI